MSAAIVTLDLGNSGCKLCVWDGHASTPLERASFAVAPTLIDELLEHLRRVGSRFSTPSVALSCVAGKDVEAALRRALEREFGARFVGTPDCGLEVAVAEPQSVGDDRLFAARGAVELVARSAIVVDAGTAVTVDALEVRGDRARARFLGGAIAPGPSLLAHSLAHGTARLPLVEARGHVAALGHDTRSAVLSGVVHGFRGAVRELVRAVAHESGVGESTIVLTGGASALLVEPAVFERASTVNDVDLVHRGLLSAARGA